MEKYQCPKCGNRDYDVSEISATGSGLSKFLDVQSNKFTTVTCANCKYTEFYKAESSALSNIFDLVFGG